MATAVAVAAGAGLCTAVTAPPAVAADQPGAAKSTTTRTTAVATNATDAVLPTQARYRPRQDDLVEAGMTGYLHKREGHKGRYWTDYATGETRELPALAEEGGHSGLRATVSSGTEPDGTKDVVITDLATGSTTTMSMPEGAEFSRAYTPDLIVVHRYSRDHKTATMSILRRAADGSVDERPVTGVPEGLDSRIWPSGSLQQDARGAVMFFGRVNDNDSTDYLLDYETARLTPLHEVRDVPGIYTIPKLTERRVVVAHVPYESVTTIDRSNPTAAPVVTPLPKPQNGDLPYAVIAITGDWVVVARHLAPEGEAFVGGRLTAVPIGGGESRELLRHSSPHLVQTPDGSALVAGGSSGKDWAVHRITSGADGLPKLTKVRDLPPVPAQVKALALGAGRLGYASDADGSHETSLYDHEVSFTGTPAVGERRLLGGYWASPDSVQALGDGRFGFSSDGLHVPNPGRPASTVWSYRARLLEAVGRYSILLGEDRSQHIGDIRLNDGHRVTMTRPNTAASIWGDRMWTPGRAVGTIAQYSFANKRTTIDFHLDSGCTPDRLQAVGRWVYWSCGSGATAKAGVWDHKVRKSIPVPTNGAARLGDGFVVREADGKLLLTDFHRGAGGAVTTREFAAVPAGAKWAVDKFGGDVAFTDAEGSIRIRPVNVPRSPIAVVEGVADTTTAGDAAWNARWQLSRPPASWTVTVKNATGATVRTLTSKDRSGAQIEAVWDTKDTTGKPAPAGSYTWTLTATPPDSTTPAVLRTGRTTVSTTAPR